MWQALIKPVIDLATTTIKGKQQIKQAKIDAEAQRVATDQHWEIEMARASATSWKDELWTLVFAGIVVACFIPPAQPYISDGFDYLSMTPVWFQWCVGVSVGASFGVKGWREFKMK